VPKSNIVHGKREPEFIRQIKRHQVHETIIEMMDNKELDALKLLKQHIDSAILKCEGS